MTQATVKAFIGHNPDKERSSSFSGLTWNIIFIVGNYSGKPKEKRGREIFRRIVSHALFAAFDTKRFLKSQFVGLLSDDFLAQSLAIGFRCRSVSRDSRPGP